MKNLKINYKYFIDKSVAFVLAIATALTFSACGKESECEITTNHAHQYVNKAGYVKYIDKEYLNYGGYNWTENYIDLTQNEVYMRNLENKHGLLRINENLDTILTIQDNNEDYMEYRYAYTYLIPIPHATRIGNSTMTYITYIPTTKYSWTSDENHSRLTGENRLCHYMYQGYKIEINDKGKEVLVPSEYVDDLTTIMDEYPYIKENYFKVFNQKSNCELDYEDGPEEELSEEELKDRYSKIDPSYQGTSNTNIEQGSNKVMCLVHNKKA